MTSQIQDGGRKCRHKSKMAAIHIIHSGAKRFPKGLAKMHKHKPGPNDMQCMSEKV